MMRAVEDHYISGKPRHIASPESSIFKVLTEDEFECMSDKAVQDTLSRQHIVVTGRKKPKYKFDLDGLETLAPLDKLITIQGK